MPNTPIQALPYPSMADAANGPVAFQNLGVAVEKKVVMVFASAADRTAKVPAPTAGMMCWLTDVKQLAIYDTGQWVTLYPPVPVYAQAAGQVSFAVAASDTQKQAVVTFPASRFSQPPMVVAMNVQGSAQMYVVAVGPATATSITLQVTHRDTSGTLGSAVTINVQWHAIQMTSSSGAG